MIIVSNPTSGIALQDACSVLAQGKLRVMAAASGTQPVSVKKRVLPLSCERDTSPDCRSFSRLLSASAKKLKRLPHLFGRVLELPVDADASVDVKEDDFEYRFSVPLSGLVADQVRAEVIEIVPGATKVVIKGAESLALALEDLEVDLWRFRLPPDTLPCQTTATYEDGCLIVTVPIAGTSETAAEAGPDTGGDASSPVPADTAGSRDKTMKATSVKFMFQRDSGAECDAQVVDNLKVAALSSIAE